MLRFSDHCSRTFLALSLIVWCWQNCQFVLRRARRAPVSQWGKANNNSRGEPHYKRPPLWLCPGRLTSKLPIIEYRNFGLLAKFNSMEKAFLIGVAVWNFLSGYLSVSMQKDVSGLLIFLVDFYVQSWKINRNSSFTKQGKNYFNLTNFGNFLIFPIYLWSINYADSFDMLLAMVYKNFQFSGWVHSHCTQCTRSVNFSGRCHIWVEDNGQWPWFSSQIKSPFLNRRQSLKFFKCKRFVNEISGFPQNRC